MSFFRAAFTARSAEMRIRFGAGVRRDLAQELDALGCRRALILTAPQQSGLVAEFAAYCGSRMAGSFTGAQMHTPVDVSEAATTQAREIGAGVVVAVGGGSTTGLAKAIALRTDLPQIVLPTTYAGSEVTAILGQTENGIKTTLTSPRVQPEVALYDPELVVGLPVALTVTSALNAMAHAAEGLYAVDRSPLSSLMAVEGMRTFRDALPRVIAAPDDLEARAETLYGAWLCGVFLGQVGMALHHKLCHTLGGSFDLPHAETHAVILPHAIAYNAVAVPDLLAPVSDLFGGADPGGALYRFAGQVAAPRALRDLGLAEADLDRVAELATANPYSNPRPVERDAIRRLLQAAWEGTAPVA